jgi:hypothetical protein
VFVEPFQDNMPSLSQGRAVACTVHNDICLWLSHDMTSATPEASLCFLSAEDIHYPLEELSIFLICPQRVICWMNMFERHKQPSPQGWK